MIKAITLHQPLASLVAWGCKYVETRTYKTNHRGTLAIHSAGRFTPEGKLFMETNTRIGQMLIDRKLDYFDLPLGQVLAIVDVIAVKPTKTAARKLDERQQSFGNYEPGRYAWFLDPIVELADPILTRGFQGFWNWDPPANVQAIADEMEKHRLENLNCNYEKLQQIAGELGTVHYLGPW